MADGENDKELSDKERLFKYGGNYVHQKVRSGGKLKVKQVSTQKTKNKVVVRIPRGVRIRIKKV